MKRRAFITLIGIAASPPIVAPILSKEVELSPDVKVIGFTPSELHESDAWRQFKARAEQAMGNMDDWEIVEGPAW